MELKKIIDELPCAYLCLQKEKEYFQEKNNYLVVDVNKCFEELSGFDREEIYNGNYTNNSFINQVIENINLYNNNEFKLFSSVKNKWYYANLSFHDEDIISIIFNEVIYEKELENSEEAIKQPIKIKKEYLYFDKLTGLFNREYFEDQLQKLEKKENMQVAIIFGDVNGLKTANDVFGHLEGDKVLKSISRILKRNCSEDAVISRWGGDEFGIILPEADNEKANKICNSIYKSCNESSFGKVKPSIALGFAVKDSIEKSTIKVLQEAEVNMYKRKNEDKKGTKNYLIHTLENTLFEKSNENREHSERLKTLSVKLAGMLKLSDTEIDELSLLSTFHDIGKIGIPDYIMFKPSPLSDDEWNMMKKHPEIGYKIAKSTNDIAHISKYILFHHERWDGGGYPQGLKGNSIPKLSRIISIIDAYDVMTHRSPYKDFISIEKACEEIKKNSGTQFDPILVESFLEMIKPGN